MPSITSDIDEALKLAREVVATDSDAAQFLEKFTGPRWREVYDRACRETPRRLDATLVTLARALLALAEQRTEPPKRNAHVERMLALIKRQGDYHEDVPKHWMREDHGQERALLRYIEELEAYVGAAAKETKT